jgi:hypothetical protein
MMIRMDKSRLKFVLFGGTLAAVFCFATGCEWTGSSNDGAWSDSMSWINFSGLYRAPSGRNLVGDFASATVVPTDGGTGGSTDGGTGGGTTTPVEKDTEYAYSDVPGISRSTMFTTVSGTIDYPNRGRPGWRLKAGSVTVRFVGTITPAVGSFSDNGNGGLTGTFSQEPGGPVLGGTGTINYDTGAWSLSLSSTFAQPSQFSYSYVLLQLAGTGGAPPLPPDGGGGGGTNSPPNGSITTVGGVINTMQIDQQGNRLTFITSRGHVLEGDLRIVTLPGGDRTGRTPGDVSATYEVRGVIEGQSVKITGTLSGDYTPPPENGVTGNLRNRTLQGIWMQPNGTADVFGVAPQMSAPIDLEDFRPTFEQSQNQ